MQDRLRQIIQKKELTAASFADKIGVQRSSISHILSGRNKPSIDFLSKLINTYSDISLEWLITGKGSLLKTKDYSKVIESNTKPLQASIQTNISEEKQEVTNVTLDNQSQNADKVTKVNNDIPIIKPSTSELRKTIRIVNFFNDHTFEEFYPTE